MKESSSLLSIADASVILGLSRRSAYRWAVEGVLPTVHSGRRVMVPLVGLAKMLQMSLGELRKYIETGSAEP